MATQLELFVLPTAGAPDDEEEVASGTTSPSSNPNEWVRPEIDPPDPDGLGFYDYHIGLVACSKSKLPHAAPARELYTGSLFRKARAYCERMCSQWYVLSAKHGLVHPDQVIEPYEQTLATASPGERLAWGRRVLAQFMKSPGDGRVWQFVILAGRTYWESIPREFFRLGTHSFPLKGCRGMGDQQARLAALSAQWDGWLAPPQEAEPKELPNVTGWEAATWRKTVWAREKGGTWHGPFDVGRYGQGDFRCRAQYRQSRNYKSIHDAEVPKNLFINLERLFPNPKQTALLGNHEIARRGRKRYALPQETTEP